MEQFCIILNGEKPENLEIAKGIKAFLEEHKKGCQILEDKAFFVGNIKHFTDIDQIAPNTDCAIVLGGDGTMIQASIDLVHCDIPILGVNTGTLGFLTGADYETIKPAIERLLQGDYRIEKRIMLKEILKFPGVDSKTSCYALNDFVITKQGKCRLITIKVYVHDELADIFQADGLIISTPTGSTGYNLSAGGPILVPSIHSTVITPICPHSLNKRSLVLDAADEIVLEIGQTKDFEDDEALLSADGRRVGDLKTGDKLCIKVPNATTEFIRLSGVSFYERMREKLNGN